VRIHPRRQNIATQSLAVFDRLGDVQTRVVAVDERMGIVWLRMAWGMRERGGDQLTVSSLLAMPLDNHTVTGVRRVIDLYSECVAGSQQQRVDTVSVDDAFLRRGPEHGKSPVL
jgi:hypothetical protein